MHRDLHATRLGLDTVPDAVLDQWLQNEVGDGGSARLGIDLGGDPSLPCLPPQDRLVGVLAGPAPRRVAESSWGVVRVVDDDGSVVGDEVLVRRALRSPDLVGRTSDDRREPIGRARHGTGRRAGGELRRGFRHLLFERLDGGRQPLGGLTRQSTGE